MKGLVLVVPEKPDAERDAVAAAWTAAGGTVERLGRFWDPPALDPARVRVYGNDTFCLVLAEKLGLELLAPADRLLEDVPRDLLARDLRIVTLADAVTGAFPSFVKPVTPKQFRAAVYASSGELATETHGVASSDAVMVAEVVRFGAEARAFVLDRAVRTCAIYEGLADVTAAARFAARAVEAVALPRTCVVDVGLVASGDWALVECNATWGAGLNGCDPAAAIACIEAATRPAQR